jgi:hypothetical protein
MMESDVLMDSRKACCLAMVYFVGLGGCERTPAPPAPPTTAAWGSAVGEERTELMQAVRDSRAAIGLTPDELVEWLGEPDKWGQVLTYYPTAAPGRRSRGAMMVHLDSEGNVAAISRSLPSAPNASAPHQAVDDFAEIPIDEALRRASQAWQHGTSQDRLSVAHWLAGGVDSPLIGAEKAGVLKLLGPPDRESPVFMTYDGRDRAGKRDMLAPYLGCQVRNGKVVRAEVGSRADT